MLKDGRPRQAARVVSAPSRAAASRIVSGGKLMAGPDRLGDVERPVHAGPAAAGPEVRHDLGREVLERVVGQHLGREAGPPDADLVAAGRRRSRAPGSAGGGRGGSRGQALDADHSEVDAEATGPPPRDRTALARVVEGFAMPMPSRVTRKVRRDFIAPSSRESDDGARPASPGERVLAGQAFGRQAGAHLGEVAGEAGRLNHGGVHAGRDDTVAEAGRGSRRRGRRSCRGW